MEWKNLSESDYGALAAELLAKANGQRKWMIHGDLGAGKTTFVQSLCRTLNCSSAANSPTYSIVNQYDGHWNDKPVIIHHIDLYRLESLEECFQIGIEEYLDDDSFCFIEWPEIIRPIWPPGALEIKIDILPDMKRNILFL